MIKTLHIVKALGLGGTEKVMQPMAAGLNCGKFIPVVLSLENGERPPLLRKSGIDTCIEGDLFNDILKRKPDIIRIHREGWPEPELLRPAIQARRKLESKSGRIWPYSADC